jgi:Tfp pilus assembly protein PilF
MPAARATTRALAALLVLVCVATYHPVLRHDFVDYDDDVYVTENPRVRAGLTPGGVVWAFTTGHAANWHPLTWLSHMLDVTLFGLAPGAHHGVSLVLHVGNTLLLFAGLCRMTGAPWRSALVAALFAAHPLHVESVAWVAERKDVLATFFWFLTIAAYRRWVARPRVVTYLTVVACLALGLMAKPTLVTVPFSLLLLDLWPLRRLDPGGPAAEVARRAGRLVVEKLPLLVLVAVVSAVTLIVQTRGGAVPDAAAFPLAVRVGNALVAWVRYVWMTFWPVGLAVIHPYPAAPLSPPVVLGAATLLAGATAGALAGIRRRPWLAVGWLWYLGTLVPVIGLVQVGSQGLAERYTYVPLVGLFVVVAWAVPRPRAARARRRVGAAAAAVVLALGALAWRQTLVWRTSETLFRDALRTTRRNAIAHHYYGLARLARQDHARAVAHFRRAVEIEPGYTDARVNLEVQLGNARVRQGALAAAVPHYRAALAVAPATAEAHYNLALVLERLGRRAEAQRHLAEAVRLDERLRPP